MAKDNAKFTIHNAQRRYIEAVKTADIISEKLNIPLGDLVDVFAEIPTADVVEVPESGIGDLSDGYHTYNELYHHRAILFSVICNLMPDRAWKSKLHDTGDMFDGMFIVGIETPDGQATYHYDVNPYWDMFKVKELEKAPKWDGHTSTDAINRIAKISLGDAKQKYIDAEKFKEVLKVHFDALYREDGELLYSDHMCIGEDVDDLIKLVEEQPAADVVEVKYGHIVRNERNIAKMKEFHEKGIGLGIGEKSIFWTCSECDSFIRPYDKYCSECGAKMRGD